jgi:hypothetical protein
MKFDKFFKDMNPKTLIVSLIFGFIVFIAISLSTNIFTSGDLPIQLSGAFFQAVITALMTYFLLAGQTKQEELKERNVKVFEEKSRRFNDFINKLWDVWEDREVSLEELDQLMKIVSKDIVPFSKPETVNIILDNLLIIAELSNKADENKRNSENTGKIQEHIFNIINELAKDVGLGGEINQCTRTKLNELEKKVVPYLIQKKFKIELFEKIKKLIDDSEELDISDVSYDHNKILRCRIKNSNVYLHVGPLERPVGHSVMVSFYVEFWGNRNYTNYRDAARGWRKDYLRGSIDWKNSNEILNLNDYSKIEELYYRTSSMKLEDKPEYKIFAQITDKYKKWNTNGKNIEVIVEECEGKK